MGRCCIVMLPSDLLFALMGAGGVLETTDHVALRAVGIGAIAATAVFFAWLALRDPGNGARL